MKIDDRYSATVWADEQAYNDYADYRNFVVNLIQEKLSKELITALCTKGSIIAIKGDSATRKDESTGGIYCRQDIYVKELVRCKDCAYYIPEVDEPHKSTCQRLWGGMTECKADSYCSDGVRRDEMEE